MRRQGSGPRMDQTSVTETDLPTYEFLKSDSQSGPASKNQIRPSVPKVDWADGALSTHRQLETQRIKSLKRLLGMKKALQPAVALCLVLSGLIVTSPASAAPRARILYVVSDAETGEPQGIFMRRVGSKPQQLTES